MQYNTDRLVSAGFAALPTRRAKPEWQQKFYFVQMVWLSGQYEVLAEICV